MHTKSNRGVSLLEIMVFILFIAFAYKIVEAVIAAPNKTIFTERISVEEKTMFMLSIAGHNDVVYIKKSHDLPALGCTEAYHFAAHVHTNKGTFLICRGVDRLDSFFTITPLVVPDLRTPAERLEEEQDKP